MEASLPAAVDDLHPYAEANDPREVAPWLNAPQRVALVLGFLFALGMLLYPPWACAKFRIEDSGRTFRYRIGSVYAWLWSPPHRIMHKDGSGLDETVGIDQTRLLVQCLAVAVATAAAVVALGWPRGRRRARPDCAVGHRVGK